MSASKTSADDGSTPGSAASQKKHGAEAPCFFAEVRDYFAMPRMAFMANWCISLSTLEKACCIWLSFCISFFNISNSLGVKDREENQS